jgi:hypothetical protein
MYSIDQVVYDPNAPAYLLALSTQQNVLQIFEAKGTGSKFECNVKGVIRFAANLTSMNLQSAT